MSCCDSFEYPIDYHVQVIIILVSLSISETITTFINNYIISLLLITITIKITNNIKIIITITRNGALTFIMDMHLGVSSVLMDLQTIELGSGRPCRSRLS